MNISKKWLQDYLELTCDDRTLCDKLTMAGIEVEGVETRSLVPAGVIAAEIRSRKPHPSSDHLSVCIVFDGTKELQIVCGAPNCDAGKIVPLATIGTCFSTPEGEFKIKKSKLRGVESNGMMCSQAELGLGSDDTGLMILNSDIKPGTPLDSLFPGDTQMELEITPNRPDCLSMWGVARDLSCLLGTPAKLPEINIPECNNIIPNMVTVEAPELCPRYIGRVIEGVKIGPSPQWLIERLESVGLRSINNVVDVTNFVMMELGHPLHAFDRQKLAGGNVIVRRAKPGEEITILDGRKLKLEDRHLVIADSEKPMAVAGIMGGEFSGVTSETTTILLESAVFFSSNIRASSRELGVSTDASYRYERGVDYDMAELASKRACQLILATAGGRIASAPLDVNTGRPKETVIPCRFEMIRKLIGTKVSNERIVEILQGLHLKVSEITSVGCQVTAPLFRLDLTREADLAEEVERIDGLDKIPVIPVSGKICHPDSEDAYTPIRKLRDLMVGLGFYECIHYSIVSAASAFCDNRFNQDDVITLSNPINPENSIMRPSLLGEILGTIGRNISRGNRDLRLFELDQAFCKNPKKYPEERYELAIALTGRRHSERYGSEGECKYDFYDMKGVIETILDLLGISNYRFVVSTDDNRYRSGHSASLEVEGKCIGSFGEISENLAKTWRSTDPVFTAQIDVSPLLTAAEHVKRFYKAPAQYPKIERDVAFTAPETLTHGEIIQFIRKAKPANLETLHLFDIFMDKEMKANGVKSMAYTLSFRHPERTLTDNEVNAAMDKLREKLVSGLNVELR